MIRAVSGQVMTDRSVGSADATPESRVRRAPSTVSASCSACLIRLVEVNHRMTIWGDRSR